MNIPAPTKYEILKSPYGKYVWWPDLQLVDFVSKGKNKGTQIASMDVKKNNEMEALSVAAKHLGVLLKEKRADKRLKEENLGITDDWN